MLKRVILLAIFSLVLTSGLMAQVKDSVVIATKDRDSVVTIVREMLDLQQTAEKLQKDFNSEVERLERQYQLARLRLDNLLLGIMNKLGISQEKYILSDDLSKFIKAPPKKE